MGNVKFVDSALKVNATLTIILDTSLNIPNTALEAAHTAGIDLASVMKVHGYEAKEGESLAIPTGDKKIENILLFGTGEPITALKALLLGYKLRKKLAKLSSKKANVYFSEQLLNQPGKEIMFNLLLGCIMGEYKFDKYKTPPQEKNNKSLVEIEVVAENSNQLNLALEHYSNLADSIALTKDLISEPPNVKTPISMASACTDLTKYGLDVQILDEGELRALGMNSLLGVAQGSTNAPRVVVMKWQGANNNTQPFALIGKGVTFDSGGLSLKPSASMETMKKDMAGSAVIIGAMRTLALRKVKANVVGVLGLVENMPDGRAQRPSDIVRSMSGQTIEVLNTDAEGRLLLADVLWYAQSVFKPSGMIDLATLTGAMRICLGSKMAGLFSNDDNIADKLYETGIQTGERLWRLPLNKDYDKLIDSKIADVKNIASPNSGAGSIVAAQFLQRFVNNTPWAHLDIAAVTDEEDTNEGNKGQPHGPTAFGVRLLVKFIENYYTVS